MSKNNAKPLDQVLKSGDELCVYEMDKDNLPDITNEWCTYENVQAYLNKALAMEREKIVNDVLFELQQAILTINSRYTTLPIVAGPNVLTEVSKFYKHTKKRLSNLLNNSNEQNAE